MDTTAKNDSVEALSIDDIKTEIHELEKKYTAGTITSQEANRLRDLKSARANIRGAMQLW